MGAKGAFAVANSLMVFVTMAALQSQIVGFDASTLIHLLLVRHALPILDRNDWRDLDHDARSTCTNLLSSGIRPWLVFDGRRLVFKTTNESRTQKRMKSLAELEESNIMLRALREQLERASGDLLGAVYAEDGPSVEQAMEEVESHRQSVAETTESCRKLAAQAVGSKAIEAAQRFMLICKEFDIKITVAPYEAETQLVWLQLMCHISTIVAYDADYMALGASPVMLDNRWRQGGGKVLVRGFAEPDKVAGRPKPAKASPLYEAACHYNVYDVVRISSYFLPNDYAKLDGIGIGTVG